MSKGSKDPMSAPESAPRRVFDVGINEKMPLKEAILMGLQNVFVMAGIFVFPGIMGKSFNLPPDIVAYLYCVSFVGCGVTTVLMCSCFGRMPLVAGSYAGVFAAILTLGHLPNADLGTALGSLMVASLIWCLLAIPVRGVSVVSLVARYVRTPVISGVIIMLVMMQIADLALPHWLGKPHDPTFPLINFGAGLVTAVVLMCLIVSKRPIVKRLSLLISLVAGTALFEVLHPIDFTAVIESPWFVMPKLFPFGLSFNPEFCLIFFVILVAINIQTMTLMGVVAEWAHEDMPPARLSMGVLSMMLGSAIAAAIGSFSNIPYPANVAILRSTRVASRHVGLASGIILILMGFCTKVDYIFVLLPVPILAAAATVLFGAVFVHAVEMLVDVEWDNRSVTITGFALMAGFGTLFLEREVLATMPFLLSLLLRQPIIIGVVSLLVLEVVLPGRKKTPEHRPEAAPKGNNAGRDAAQTSDQPVTGHVA